MITQYFKSMMEYKEAAAALAVSLLLIGIPGLVVVMLLVLAKTLGVYCG